MQPHGPLCQANCRKTEKGVATILFNTLPIVTESFSLSYMLKKKKRKKNLFLTSCRSDNVDCIPDHE